MNVARAALSILLCAACAGACTSAPSPPSPPFPVDDVSGTEDGARDPDAPSVDLGGAPDRDDDANDPPPDDRAPAASSGAFATRVVSFAPGACAGFGSAALPDVVLGPPEGAGDARGSLDVVSLGRGGEIVVSFEPSAIVDGPGVDLLVFENAFYRAGIPDEPYVEPAEVSVSDDGQKWTTFPCASSAPPYTGCAGLRPVYASSESGISPLDPARAGGDGFDLATIGVSRARFVRIKDRTAQACPPSGPVTNGFDLDAVAAVHAAAP